jgi:F-type H+-transporting ATPase subunit b
LSVLWVVLAVLILAVALDKLLFKPLTRVMRERETAVKSALEIAQSAESRARAATAEFDATVTAARTEIYRQMDERRRAAEAYRQELMAKTRAEIEGTLAEARAKLEAQTADARATLERDADVLGKEIADKVLRRG